MANQYVFLPWLRRGLAKGIKDADPLAAGDGVPARSVTDLSIQIMGDDQKRDAVNRSISLFGPGDVVGISSASIVKTQPGRGETNFEPNFFPYIEFYDEDFPWRYTPAAPVAERRLRPWITLIVLEETEFERMQVRAAATNRVIRILTNPVGKVFPPPSQIWAWTHVQVNDGALTATELAETGSRNQKLAASLNNNPNLGVSRLICPRRLKKNKSYFAFVVPSFESGRKAGLGAKKEEIDAVKRFTPAWSATENTADLFPVYYEWNFRTGEEDFETLAKKIVPRDLTGTDVGRIWIDANNINYGELFDYKGNIDPSKPERKGFLPFDGALKLPAPPEPKLTQREGITEIEFVDHFSKLINLGVQYRLKSKSELQWGIDALGSQNDDPLLVPPIYGRWYVKQDGNTTVDPSLKDNWLEQLNLDPAFRVAAGLGTEVVREHQEEFMTRSWEQLADYRRNLNTELQRLRFSQEVTKAIYQKHFNQPDASGDNTNKLLALTQSIHTLIKSDQADFSIAGKLAASKTDTAFVQPVYRRLTRSNGPVMRKVKTTNSYRAVMSSSIQFSVMSFIIFQRPPYENFSAVMLAQFDPTKFRVVFDRFTRRPILTLAQPNWFGDFPESFFRVPPAPFQQAIKDLQQTVLPKPLLLKPQPFDIQMLSQKVKAKIEPTNSFRMFYASKIPVNAPAPVATNETISPNTFNPFFTDPTYDQLAKLKKELFIPNLDKIDANSFVLLQANSAFIEAYLVGLNHEMGSEYLWRGFPADLNATYFRQFWDVSDCPVTGLDQSNIKPIRSWAPTHSIGKNGPAGSVENPLVFVIKAELVRKYPNLVVYAQRAVMDGQFRKPDKNSTMLAPIFLSNMSPDFLFAGFDLTTDRVLGKTNDPAEKAGWYFVVGERPGEMNFGLDESRPATDPFATWNDLAWTDLPTGVDYINLDQHIPADPTARNGLIWGKGESPITADPVKGSGDSAQMAAVLQQRPVQIFIHASMLVK